jgi:cyclic-di-GMP phosphodiesterase, flagellum assembly factor TipF
MNISRRQARGRFAERQTPPVVGLGMGRLSAIFIAICLALIAGSAGAVVYLWFGFTGMESTVVAVATATALVMLNSVTGRARDRDDVGAQIADLSRGTADIGRQMSELDRRMVALEAELKAANDRTRAATEPLGNEIDELGQLVKELADAVAAHERMLAAPPVKMSARAAAPVLPVESAETAETEDSAELVEPEAPSTRAASGRFRGMEQAEIVALIARAIEANRVDLFLQPVVTLPQRKVRYYEAVTRLRGEDEAQYAPEDYRAFAESAGLTPAIDNLMVFRSVQVVRRLTNKNREVGLFCAMSGATLVNAAVFREIGDFLEANRALAQFIVFQFPQSAVRAMGPIETEALAGLAALGFRFSIDQVGDLRIEPRELAERGFRFIKVPASLLLSRAAQPGADIHPADFSDLLGRFGIDLIAEKIERESTVVDLLDYDVRFGQGPLFSPPRPVRTEVLQGLAERTQPSTAPRERPARDTDDDPPRTPEPRPAAGRTSGGMAQLARGIVRRA